jgi:saccharopine dehydrogenase (NAD+, L-lysine-forming)
MGKQKKVAVLGCGGVGQVIGQLLAKSDLVSELVLADIDMSGAEMVAARTGSDKITAEKVDGSSVASVAKLARKVDIVVNGTVPMLNLKIMHGCLKGGASYIDMASGDREFGHPMLEDQFPQDERWRDAGLLALVSMGIDPGASNLFAKRAADRMESVEHVKVRDADTGALEGYEFATYFSPQAMMEEVLRDPLYWEEGQFKRSPALEVSEEYEFPHPVGKQKVFRTDHEESELVPQFLGKPVGFVDFKITLDEKFVETVRFLRRLGLTETKPLKVNGMDVRPFDVVVAAMPRPDALSGKIKGIACVLTEVKGRMDGRDTVIRTWTHISHERAHEICGIHATSYQTACPVAVAVEMIARGEIRETGVKPPETIDPVRFCEYLPEKEIPVFEDATVL